MILEEEMNEIKVGDKTYKIESFEISDNGDININVNNTELTIEI